MNILILLVLVSFLEIGIRLFQGGVDETSCQNCRNYEEHEDLGYWNIPNSSHIAERSCGADLCYRVTYSYDHQGRRVVAPGSGNRQSHLILLGGSYAFGQGLADEQTLAYHLQERSDFQVLNYARPGVGPPYVLRQFEINMIQPERKKGVALFILPHFHEDRITMNSTHFWLWKTPGYHQCGEEDICSIGFQENIGSLQANFLKIYSWLSFNSKVFGYLGGRVHSKSREERLNLMARTLKKIKNSYEGKFRGRFFVILLPDIEYPKDFIRSLKRASLPLLKLRDSQFQMHEKNLCQCDSHPSAVYTSYFADEILSLLDKNGVR